MRAVPFFRPHVRASHGHVCRGGYGGHLHALCGEVEDPDTETVVETNGICPPCARKQPPAGKSLSAGKRKATGAPSVDGGKGSKKPARGQAKTNTGLLNQAEALTSCRQAGAVRRAYDKRVPELTAALNALNVGLHEATQGSGVQDTELCKVMPNPDIVPGKPAHQATIDAT